MKNRTMITALLIALSLTACGKQDTSADVPTPTTSTEVVTSAPAIEENTENTETSTPAEETSTPAEDSVETTTPAEESTSTPSEETSTPAEDTTTPAETSAPVENTANSSTSNNTASSNTNTATSSNNTSNNATTSSSNSNTTSSNNTANTTTSNTATSGNNTASSNTTDNTSASTSSNNSATSSSNTSNNTASSNTNNTASSNDTASSNTTTSSNNTASSNTTSSNTSASNTTTNTTNNTSASSNSNSTTSSSNATSSNNNKNYTITTETTETSSRTYITPKANPNIKLTANTSSDISMIPADGTYENFTVKTRAVDLTTCTTYGTAKVNASNGTVSFTPAEMYGGTFTSMADYIVLPTNGAALLSVETDASTLAYYTWEFDNKATAQIYIFSPEGKILGYGYPGDTIGAVVAGFEYVYIVGQPCAGPQYWTAAADASIPTVTYSNFNFTYITDNMVLPEGSVKVGTTHHNWSMSSYILASGYNESTGNIVLDGDSYASTDLYFINTGYTYISTNYYDAMEGVFSVGEGVDKLIKHAYSGNSGATIYTNIYFHD